ncbi:MAG: immunoglobulin domain-containing protein [Prevotella sp.]|nr:immunoglobulin domain-containing protein [Prevotella sp.]
MKKFLLNVLAIVSVFLICGNLTAWGQETQKTLFSIDFSEFKDGTPFPDGQTTNGIYVKGSGCSVSNPKSNNGTLTFPSGSNMSSSRYLAIPISGVNNKVNVTIELNVAAKLRYKFKKGTNVSYEEYEETKEKQTTISLPYTITGTGNDVVFLFGQQSSYYKSIIKSITITTPITGPTPASISVVSNNPYSVQVNNKATLEVSASGNPEPTLQWYECDDTKKTNARLIEGATDSKYEFTPTTAGTQYYYCEAKNTTDTENTDVSDVITVNVQDYIPSSDANITGIKVNNAIDAIANGTDYTAVLLNYPNETVEAVVTLSDSKATIEGGTTLTVTLGEKKDFQVKAEDGTIKDYSITVKNTNDVNVAENKFAISSDGLYTNGQKFIAPDIVASLSETCVTAGTSFAVDGSKPNYVNTDFANTILGANNPSISSNVPTGGHFVKFVPSKDGKLDVAVFLNAGKELNVVENTTRLSNTGFTAAFKVNNAGEIVDQAFSSNTVDTPAAGIISLNVTTGNTYYVFCSGSKIGFQGFVFTPAVDPYTLTTEDTDYYSLYLDYNATVPKNVTAYTGSLSADEKTLVLSQINDGVIPANQGVLVKSTVAGSYTFNQSATDPSATSVLKGVTTATEVSALEVEGKTVLTLGTKGGVIGFRKPAGTSIGANKAYLLVTTPSGGSTAPELVIGIDDDETTGINGVKAENADVDAPMFNIAGQRVSNNAKGLVIKNGKKYMLK